MNIFTQIREICYNLTESKTFKNVIVIIILINSIVLGLITSETIYAKFGKFLELILSTSVVIFTIEIILRIIAKGWRFFLNGWNIFDFLLVAIAFLPESGAAITFRIFRVLRALRMVSSLKKLRHIVSAILVSAPHVFWAAILLLIIFYIFGIIGQSLFHENFPQWFGTLGDTNICVIKNKPNTINIKGNNRTESKLLCIFRYCSEECKYVFKRFVSYTMESPVNGLNVLSYTFMTLFFVSI